MKCFSHVDMDATATCQSCGKGLCVNCTNRFAVALCEPCLLNHNKIVAREMYTGLIVTVIVFAGATWFFSTLGSGSGKSLGFTNAAPMGVLLAFAYWGWKFLTDHFPRLLMGSGPAWLIYLMFKFITATLIGLLVGPYQILKMLKEIHSVRKTQRQIASGEL